MDILRSIIVISISCFLFGCKKDHTCECVDGNGAVYARQTFHETKRKAKELCPKGMIMFAVVHNDSHCYLKN